MQILTVEDLIRELEKLPKNLNIKLIASDCEGGNSFYNIDVVNSFKLSGERVVGIGSTENLC